MSSPLPSVIIGVLGLAAASGASGQALSDAATHAPPQHYMITLPTTPVAEVAEVVLGESLGLPFKVDADVKAQMAFRVDGLYAPEALAREFGYRLWNVDVALIERPSDGLWLIPKAELPAAVAAGAVLVSPVAGAPGNGAATRPAASQTPAGPVAAAPTRGLDWLWGLLFGWITGAAAVWGWMQLQRRRDRPSPVLLPAPMPVEIEAAADDELTIPTFDKNDPSLAATKGRFVP